MPKYPAEIKRNQDTGKAFCDFVKLSNLNKWLNKHIGYWIDVDIKLHKVTDPKTKDQLGYYWGLLLKEIHQELLSQGATIAVPLIIQ